MLRWRLILGTLIIPALVLWCWLDAVSTRPGVLLLPLALLLSWAAVVELLDMFKKRGLMPTGWVVYTGVLLTVLLSSLPAIWPDAAAHLGIGRLGWMAIGLGAGMLLAFIGEFARYDGHRHVIPNLGVSALAILYIGGFLGFIVQLRILRGQTWGEDGRWGMLALVSLIAIVKMSDTGQYTAGRLFGRHKLAPLVSPGKTWEGAVGGLIFAILAAWLVFTYAAPAIVGKAAFTFAPSPIAVGAYAIALAAAGIVGDLAESMLKRDAQVKDSSSWLPGFGGVLDLLDSLLGAAPVAYALWVFGLVGPR
jgi:phosphatidate cytidylyltransferase